MKNKKIVYIIVEGPSDDTALSMVFNQFYNENEVYVEVTHCDITTKEGVNPTNIIKVINNMIKEYRDKYHFKLSDFFKIIHIIDTDGAYISDEKIIFDKNAKDPRYELDAIYTANPKAIQLRNKQKRENVDRLSLLPEINRIPYKAYYMSSCLDHVLYNKLNSTNSEKEEDAYDFAIKYENKLEKFIDFISDSSFSVKKDFKESWNYIKESNNSLNRYTNIHLNFEKDSQES